MEKNKNILDDSSFILKEHSLIIIRENNKYKIFDTNQNKTIVDNLVDVDVNKLSEGMLPIACDGNFTRIPLWGYFNVSDRTIIKLQYKRVGKFVNGYAFVEGIQIHGPYNTGVINKKGYEVISAEYRLLGDIKDDFIMGFDYVENGYLFDKNWHKISLPTTFPPRTYLGKNKFGYKSYNKYQAVYTFYPMDDFILVRSEDRYSNEVQNTYHYYVVSFNGQRIECENLYKDDLLKVKRFIKQK